jgi:hypothetical protein
VSELPAASLTYETVVAEYFLGLRGSGLMLSPLDLEVVRDWKLRGVPVPVVCRGLRFGYERAVAALLPGAAPPRSVRALRLAVEDEWRAYRAGRLAVEQPPPDELAITAARAAAALERVRAAARAASRPAIAAAHARAAAELAAMADGPRSPEALEAALDGADDAALRAWARGLSPCDRAAVGRFCAVRAGPRAAGCTRAAHRAALRAHARDYARGAGLTLLCGSV